MGRWRPPESFEGYQLEQSVGEGGMGVVYQARDTLLDRPVAIKFISSAAAPDPATRERFFVEARAIARLQHPTVVTVHRVGEVDGRPYLVSELVDGVGLDQIEAPVPWEQAARYGLDLARGLTVAHHRGVVHRDIKPANAMVTSQGKVKLLDFGIAKLLEPAGGPAARSAPHQPPPERPTADPEATRGEVPQRAAEVTASTCAAVPAPRQVSVVASTGSSLTQTGAMLGTPSYMAPEVWAGVTATFASDVYSLGALLYALCTGRPPHRAESLEELGGLVQEVDARPLAEVAPEVDPRFAAVVDRCLCRDARERYQHGNEVRAALDRVMTVRDEDHLLAGNPYRGLRPFEEEHRSSYFGRDSEIRGILERLQEDSIVVVAGDSGVGKSSLCRAGVLPRVEWWLEEHGRQWSVTTLVPGADPVSALAAALAGPLGLEADEVRQALLDDGYEVARDLRRALGRDQGLVVFIDQLEELVTLGAGAERSAAVETLTWLASPSPAVRVLATVRGDYLSRLAALPALTGPISRSLYFLWPLSSERVREAIEGPATARGVQFESGQMVAELVEATVSAGGGLPLLQFALAKLWDARDSDLGMIPAEALRNLGGVGGALGLHADEVLARLSADQREVARDLLVALVTTEGTRARRLRPELVGDRGSASEVLDALIRGRLVVARDTPEGPAYELAHEALLKGWGTLASWLVRSSEVRRVRERLGRAATEWDRLGRTAELLWSSPQLREAEGVEAEPLTEVERAFLKASRRALRRARAGRAALMLAAPLALVIGAAAVWIVSQRQVNEAVDQGLAQAHSVQQELAQTRRRLERVEAEALELFDQGEIDRAERRWKVARSLRGDVDSGLRRLSQSLEATLLLDRSREDVRAEFADLLAARARFAEELGRAAEAEELIARLRLHDDRGERLRAWSRPGRLVMSFGNRPDRVTLERYTEGEDQTLRLTPVKGVELGEGEPIELPPGSYRLTAKADGRAPVSYPFLIERGEEHRPRVEAPLIEQVPAGFVFVPGGEFFFGSDAEDGLRHDFYHAVPIHRVRSEPFLMATTETTYGQWIEFLEALEPGQRRRRRPLVPGDLVRLERVQPRGWRLLLQPTSRQFELVEGEPLLYPGREQRAGQDWRRLPVSGVSADDAEAYAAWLDRSGRVPGARLCTEREWERAARGADRRRYPHGDRLGPLEANFDATYDQQTLAMGPDEVGSHPASRSPFGVDDLAGNVWEWVRSSITDGRHVARGGSFYFDASAARIDNRELPEPAYRDVNVGLRVCADRPPR